MKYVLAILETIDETITLDNGDGFQIAIYKEKTKEILDIINIRHIEIDDDGN